MFIDLRERTEVLFPSRPERTEVLFPSRPVRAKAFILNAFALIGRFLLFFLDFIQCLLDIIQDIFDILDTY